MIADFQKIRFSYFSILFGLSLCVASSNVCLAQRQGKIVVVPSGPSVTDVRYSNDGELLVVSMSTGVQVVNAKTGDILKQLKSERTVRQAIFIDEFKVLVFRDKIVEGKLFGGGHAGIWYLEGKSEFEDISFEENGRLYDFKPVDDPESPLAFVGIKHTEKTREFLGWSQMGEVESLGFWDNDIRDFQLIPATKTMIIVGDRAGESTPNSFQVNIVDADLTGSLDSIELTSPLRSIECTGGTGSSVAVSADGKHAIVAGSEIVQAESGKTKSFGKIWNVELGSTDKVEARKLAHDVDFGYGRTNPNSIQIRPGSDQYAIGMSYVKQESALSTRTRSQVQMYEFGSGKFIWKYDTSDHGARFILSPDGKQMAVWYGNQVDIVDCESGAAVRTIVPKDFK